MTYTSSHLQNVNYHKMNVLDNLTPITLVSRSRYNVIHSPVLFYQIRRIFVLFGFFPMSFINLREIKHEGVGGNDSGGMPLEPVFSMSSTTFTLMLSSHMK